MQHICMDTEDNCKYYNRIKGYILYIDVWYTLMYIATHVAILNMMLPSIFSSSIIP